MALGIYENMQLKELYQLGKQKLKDHSIETPGLESYLLLSKSELLSDMSQVYSDGDREINQASIIKFQNLLERRIGREPSAYIAGKKEFYSKTFKVNSSVLIPRAETELLVDQCLTTIKQTQSPYVLEIGTGSGCVAITIASLREDANILATDISDEALLVAKENCRNHKQNERVSFLIADLLNSIEDNSFDIVVSNPPYISDDEFRGLEPEVKDFEPEHALLAGEDGLQYIRNIISDSKRVLKDGGYCILEIGHTQSESVLCILEEHGYSNIEFSEDINGIKRVVRAKWKK